MAIIQWYLSVRKFRKDRQKALELIKKQGAMAQEQINAARARINALGLELAAILSAPPPPWPVLPNGDIICPFEPETEILIYASQGTIDRLEKAVGQFEPFARFR